MGPPRRERVAGAPRRRRDDDGVRRVVGQRVVVDPHRHVHHARGLGAANHRVIEARVARKAVAGVARWQDLRLQHGALLHPALAADVGADALRGFLGGQLRHVPHAAQVHADDGDGRRRRDAHGAQDGAVAAHRHEDGAFAGLLLVLLQVQDGADPRLKALAKLLRQGLGHGGRLFHPRAVDDADGAVHVLAPCPTARRNAVAEGMLASIIRQRRVMGGRVGGDQLESTPVRPEPRAHPFALSLSKGRLPTAQLEEALSLEHPRSP